MNWWKNLKGNVKLKEPLKNHTTFKIGGPAKYFIEPKDIEDLKLLLNLLRRYKISTFVIGAGSNILISDKGINGTILHLNAPYFKRMRFVNGALIEIGCGLTLNRVVLTAKEQGLSGVEFLAGIPGTVGGALVMNAGLAEKNIGDIVQTVTVMDYNGKIKTLDKNQIRFGYRESNLSGYIVLHTLIKLVKKSKRAVEDEIDRYLDYRRLNQDLSHPSAGCIFKNPPQCPAGKLIDLCGLKGKRIGGAGISKKHANFIVNLEDAKATDVLKLIKFIRKKIAQKFNINLKPEIKIWQN